MAQYNYFNYGQAAQDAEAIKGMRQQNRMRGMQIEDQENVIANRKKAEEIRALYDNMPDEIEQMERDGLFKEAEQLRNHYIEIKYNTIKMMEAAAPGIDEDNYKQFRSDLIQSGAVDGSMIPVEYENNRWMRQEIAKEKNKLSTHTRKWSDQGVTFSQDFVSDEYGEIRWTGTPYEGSADLKARTGEDGEAGFKMKAADTNSIRNAAAALYEARWDPVSGSYLGLNKDQAKQVASISEEASRIYNANAGRLPHDMAVARAARKLNIDIRSLNKAGDPLGILGR